MTRPPMLGIRHVALYVNDLTAAERFWVDVMGYEVEWRPDPDNVYLHGARDAYKCSLSTAMHVSWPCTLSWLGGTMSLDWPYRTVDCPNTYH